MSLASYRAAPPRAMVAQRATSGRCLTSVYSTSISVTVEGGLPPDRDRSRNLFVRARLELPRPLA